MKTKLFARIATITLLAALAIPVQLWAQQPRYKLIDLGPFTGGAQSYVNAPANYAQVLNNNGVVAGWADTSQVDLYPSFCFNADCLVSHAFEWRNGVRTDLGALSAGVSSAANWISANGLIAGLSENGEIDPLFPGFPELRAVLWENGRITDLGTLPEGGYESLANAVNSRGQVVGLATNTIPDDFSLFGTTQARAFLWQNGVMKDLGTLGGTDAVADLVNNKGQIVGESYISLIPSAYCAKLGLPLTAGAFLWENGEMKSLGSFGGTCTFATDLNDKGEVIGISTLAGDQFQHAFLWKNGSLHELRNPLGGDNGAGIQINEGGDVVGWASLPGNQEIHASLWKDNTMTDLGTLSGDPCSLGFSLNARGQVVGISGFQQEVSGCNSGNTIRAFLWEGGSMVDLNALIPPQSALYLVAPETINDRGEIAGVGLDSIGNQHAFLLIPCRPHDPACQDAAAGTPSTRTAPLPAIQESVTVNQGSPVHQLLRPRLGFDRSAGTSQKATSDMLATSEPSISLSSSSLSFSTQAIGTTSAAKTVVLKNTGTTVLTVAGIVITGANAGDFIQTHTCGSLLAAGTSCSISISFKPTASGTRTAVLNINDNAPGSPQQVTLSGIGTTAKLSPLSLSFGSVVIDTMSPSQAVTLTNVGRTSLSITGIAITGTNAGDFGQTHTCGTSLAANASCSISITFRPTASGTRMGALSISDNSGGSPQAVALSGTGVAGRCTRQGGQCAPIFPPCCPGLQCVPASTRAFCEP